MKIAYVVESFQYQLIERDPYHGGPLLLTSFGTVPSLAKPT